MTKLCLMFKEVIRKRLERKRTQLAELEQKVNGEGVATSIEKRQYIELKAVVTELENCIDIAETMFAEVSKSNEKSDKKE